MLVDALAVTHYRPEAASIVLSMSFSQHLVIPDRSGTHVLLVEEGSGWTLPRVESDPDWALAGSAQSSVRERLGLAIVILRCVLVEHDGTGGESGDAFLFAENLGDQTPHHGSWLDEETSVAVTDGRERAAIRQWFAEKREGGPQALQPWEYAGWFTTAAAWIEARLPEITSVEQYATWCVSSVLRVEAGAGRYYFKAAPTGFRHEAVVTQKLAERFPATIPRPVAIDGERGWFLTEDFGDELVAGMEEPYWEGALDALLALQRSSVASRGSLLRSGCDDRGPRTLQDQVKELAVGGSEWLPDPMVQRLRTALPRFEDLCEEVASSPVPNTLVHGDFHANNVAMREGRYLIFDWTDACIAHPFIDLATFLYSFGPASTDPAVRERWRDRYLDGWEDLASHEEATKLFERMEPLAAMHQAISYRRLLDSLDPTEHWQFGSALQDWITRALAAPLLSA